jgi:hypothetical protein
MTQVELLGKDPPDSHYGWRLMKALMGVRQAVQHNGYGAPPFVVCVPDADFVSCLGAGVQHMMPLT